jgi:glutamine synthetase
VPKTPATLDEALDHLELDNDFLRKGDVFTPDLIETWLQYRRKEITEVQLRPHPHEFELYYDA